MSWHARARHAAQRVGIEPRYLRRFRWISKARAVRRYGGRVAQHIPYVLVGAEPDNFTYELANEDELASWVAEVAGVSRDRADAVFAEFRGDGVLAARVRRATAAHRLWSKASPPFGKRVAWYALARIVRPALAVETGTHDGLGALAVLRALERNERDGHVGRLVSFDINPSAGWMVGSHVLWDMRLEPATRGLPSLLNAGPPVGLFIHDSLHTYENERAELELGAAHLAADGVLLSDNAHATRALADVCGSSGLRYFEFRERPTGHFYPGGATGAGRR